MCLVLCTFCHEWIEEEELPAHAAQHKRLRSDGQQTDYATLPPEGRRQGDLSGVPRTYFHKRCGACTGMPEDIIRSYLNDPFLYSANRTFCTGCRDHVPYREVFWVETGEDLQTYMNRLRRAVGTAAGTRLVSVTESAARAVRKLAAQEGRGDLYFLALALTRIGPESRWRLDLAPNWDPQRETVVESLGVRIVFDKREADRAAGVVIDYSESGRGFIIRDPNA